MKAMAGQVWWIAQFNHGIHRPSDISAITLDDEFAERINVCRGVLWFPWGLKVWPVFKWHNENSEGEWNNFGCGFIILNAVRKVKKEKMRRENED